MEDIDDVTDWTSAPLSASIALCKGLHDFEAELRCSICSDFFKNPVSTKECQHTFCSECIRLTIKSQTVSTKRSAECPVCRASIDLVGGEYPLLPNGLVVTLVSRFTDIRPSLLTTLKGVASGDSAVTATRAEVLPESSPSRQNRQNESSRPIVPADDEEDVVVNLPPKRPLSKFPKIYYQGKKKKELIELCRKEGLSTHGTDDQLKDRHQRFVVFYESERKDALVENQRSVEELRKAFNDKERAKREVEKEAMFNGEASDVANMKRLTERTNGEMASIPAAFVQKVNKGYAEMIAKHKEMRKKRSIEKEDTSSLEGTAYSYDSSVTIETRQNPNTVSPPAVAPFPAPFAAPPLPTIPSQKAFAGLPAQVSHDENGHINSRLIDLSTEKSYLPSTATRETRKRKSTVLAKSSPSTIGPWNCPLCTFRNEKWTGSRAKCEACETKRPSPFC